MTMGIELEFDTNVRALTEAAYDLELCAMSEPHRYHCECEECSFDSPWPLRFQRDSSCDGELITKVFRSVDDMVPLLSQIQTLAIETDAEPGLTAGMHIHITRPRSLTPSFGAFVAWEPALEALSAGRFQANRHMNETVSRLMTGQVRMYHRLNEIIDRDPSRYAGYFSYDDVVRRVLESPTQYCDHHRAMDRHSNLNTRTRFATWEHRWPNSTRSAWRMEMFIRAAQAVHDLDIANTMSLGRIEGLDRLSLTEQMTALRGVITTKDERLGSLIDRQIAYTEEWAEKPLPELTSLA